MERMAAMATPVMARVFIAAAAVTDTLITEVVGRGSVALVVADIVAATIRAGASQVMGFTSHPSHRTADSSTGKACPITMLTMSTMNGAAPPELTRRCSHPPGSLSRSVLKHPS
jgi:hypothetical protein